MFHVKEHVVGGRARQIAGARHGEVGGDGSEDGLARLQLLDGRVEVTGLQLSLERARGQHERDAHRHRHEHGWSPIAVPSANDSQ